MNWKIVTQLRNKSFLLINESVNIAYLKRSFNKKERIQIQSKSSGIAVIGGEIKNGIPIQKETRGRETNASCPD